MALSKSSVLHYWSSRYGINPRVGGRPVFTRNNAGLFTTQEGEADTAIVNTPRSDWATLNLPNSLTERRKVLTLELARSNLLLWADDLTNSPAWTRRGTCVTLKNAMGPDGIANSATSISGLGAISVNDFYQQPSGYGATARFEPSFWIQKVTASGTLGVNTSAGVGNWSVNFASLGTGWEKITRTHPAVTISNEFVSSAGGLGGVQAFAIAGGPLAMNVWRWGTEPGVFSTSGIQTTSAAVSRAADSLYWNFPPVPQAMMAYSRHVERGTISVNGAAIWGVTDAAADDPELLVYNNGGVYTAYCNARQISLSAAPLIGDTAEEALVLTAAGAVQLIQSINGAPITTTGVSAATALPGAWSGPRLWANAQGTGAIGCVGLAELKFVKYADVAASTAQGIMDELRAFELGPNGDVL